MLTAVPLSPQASNSGARELPTAMMTTPYAALISDPTLFASAAVADVSSRNRRVIYLVVFWAGALAGAALARWSSVWVMTTLVAGLKAAVWIMVFCTRTPGVEIGIDTGHVDHERVGDSHRPPFVVNAT